MILFSSDNGPEVPTVNNMRKTHNHDGARPWRGIKRDQWEGGHRVPSFISGPAVSESLAGKVYKGTVHLVDLHRTILDLAGVAAPAQPSGVKPHDGVSMVGVLEGRAALDTPVDDERGSGCTCLSAGTTDHASTNFAAQSSIFAFFGESLR